MIPKLLIPEQEYVDAFRKYVDGLCLKWLGATDDEASIEEVLERIRSMAKVNHRATYLRYLLPLAHPRYALTMPDKPLTSMQRVLYGIYLNGMPYNDFMLRRFCEIMLRNTDKARLFAEPLPEDYKDLQKLTWTFINSFKKSANARYSYEQDIM